MQQVEIDVVGVQALEAGFGFLGQDLLGEAQGLPTGGGWRGLGGDHHLAASSGDAVPQCGFGPSHAIAFGGVEEVDADIDAVPNKLVSLDVPAFAAEMAPEGRALAEPGDVEVGVAELHQVRGTAGGLGRRWRLLATGQWSQHHGAGSRSTGLEEGPAIGRGVDVLGKQGTLGHCGLPFWSGFRGEACCRSRDCGRAGNGPPAIEWEHPGRMGSRAPVFAGFRQAGWWMTGLTGRP